MYNTWVSYRDCFTHTQCQKSLAGQRFTSRSVVMGVSYINDPWHTKCFTHTQCQKSLAGQHFTSRSVVYMGVLQECPLAQGVLHLHPLPEVLGWSALYLQVSSVRTWVSGSRECFTCTHCQKSLAGQRFTSRSVVYVHGCLAPGSASLAPIARSPWPVSALPPGQ